MRSEAQHLNKPGIFSGFFGAAVVCTLALCAIAGVFAAGNSGRQREALEAKASAMKAWNQWESWARQHCVLKGAVDIPRKGRPDTKRIYGCDNGQEYMIDAYAPIAANYCAADTAGTCSEHGLPQVPEGWHFR